MTEAAMLYWPHALARGSLALPLPRGPPLLRLADLHLPSVEGPPYGWWFKSAIRLDLEKQ